MHVNDNTLQTFWKKDDILTVNFYTTCPECLTLRLKSRDGVSLLVYGKKDDILTVNFYTTCPECLTLRLQSRDGVSLLVYGRKGKVLEAELQTVKKQAECLQLTRPQFTYDGEAAHGEDRQLALYKRFLAMEAREQQVSKELSLVLDHLRDIKRVSNISLKLHTNESDTDGVKHRTPRPDGSVALQPNVYVYLPHLRAHEESLTPNVVLGQGRAGVSLVLGIPTVKREKQSYLVSTLHSLLSNLLPSELNDTLIVVFAAEVDFEYTNKIADIVRTNFPSDVSSGLLEVVSCSQHFYPDFQNLQSTFGDSKQRVKWRTKQNLDYSFLMLYAQGKGTYYVQLEDDIIAKSGYIQTMKTYVEHLASDPWLFLEFSQLGFIGKMFRTRDLPLVIEFFLMFHKDKPIDWLLDHILWVKACHPEKSERDCDQQKSLLKHRFKPSLFQHVGLHSSLTGKIQTLKDKDFGKEVWYQGHMNPAAQLSSSLTHYQEHSLDRAYRGQDFFWGLTPTAGDHVLFHFEPPITVKRYLFQSGNIETKGDMFYNTTVQVLPNDTSVRASLVGGASQLNHTDDGFIVVGSFEDGVAKGEIDVGMQPISALRLMVHSDSEVWVLLSEIFIKV
ncbi:alpha-1,3-mannosyl-glycoprotein 4-beta-N-acetylglucosaminyltransferase B-like [Aplochiton taeniatus]